MSFFEFMSKLVTPERKQLLEPGQPPVIPEIITLVLIKFDSSMDLSILIKNGFCLL